MADMAAISSILTSIKTATEIAKMIKDADVSLEKAETKLKIAELINALAEAKIQAADVQEMLQDKDTKIAELEKAMEVKDSLSFEKNSYWIIQDEAREGPFCTHCWDRDNKLVRLHRDETNRWFCITHGKPMRLAKAW